MGSPLTALNDAAVSGLPQLGQAVTVLPETVWGTWDDECDCTYIRIGFFTNPYLAETLEIRLCCIWKQFGDLFPGAVRTTAAYFDGNAGEWVTEPREWDGEFDMPRSVWYRQLARRTGRQLADIRATYARQEPPKGRPRVAAKPARRWPFARRTG